MPDFDAKGARGSNAGDTFHELWALLHVLELLDQKKGLDAITVEGIPTDQSQSVMPTPTWEGVDCGLFFGGKTLDTASRVELAQLKYSSANRETDWSVARLCASSAKTKNNSPIRKMATDFVDARKVMRPDSSLAIRLVSNQDVGERLRTAAAARWTGSIKAADLGDEIKHDLENLQKGSGLNDVDFPAFIASLDLSGCGSTSQFALREDLIAAIGQIAGDDADLQVNQLVQEIRDLMQPGRAKDVITEHRLLTWFAATNRESLFPSPPDLKEIPDAIQRPASTEVLDHLARGERMVLLHGVGGCGKTTVTQQLRQKLPPGSVSVLFDCFGGGQYIHSDDKRHRPENAFLQITNEVAFALNVPLYISRSVNHPADIRILLSKLRLAGNALQKINPSALLVFIADAADTRLRRRRRYSRTTLASSLNSAMQTLMRFRRTSASYFRPEPDEKLP